ncbi:UDP N-acetylglucosamine transporter-like nucleotide sugar transporter [Cryptosporidium ubiquitum]|uniref:UDP N-acetylglucosamine transporter-like nucleotide sugar transporter n=1 Tax=Cryptosporidium ubiquitum TaxID=857276 RepID=A0A1J4MG48_9CRYT|nr:UDP N-acetylglucosamine transporter-like nucleotide sugar transporter [Cryptosporidium ubiquitum]OII71837.1 UDP N-acetylglucosamine transporter-like nucleotide sugar transporter [Cryptosporidium ubiquitum]
MVSKNSLTKGKGLESTSKDEGILFHEKRSLFKIRDNGSAVPRLELFYGNLNIPLRYISLLLLALKAVCVVLCTRLSFRFPAKDGHNYIPSVAVVCSEFIKLTVSLIMIFFTTGKKDIKAFPKALYLEFTSDKFGNLVVLIPGVLFLFQNNLLYISLKRLPAALYQVMYQLKILTTTYFSVLILKRKLSLTRWFACFLLIFGVVMIPKKSKHSSVEPNSGLSEFIIGLFAAFTSSFTSGLGAVVLEKVLKDTDERIRVGNGGFQTTVWGRNVILALVGIIGGVPLAYFSSKELIREHGIFQGFSPFVLLVICLNAGTGFVVVAVLKYADGILKCFCNALSIVLITLISWLFLGDTKMTPRFAFAATVVVCAVTIYSLDKAIPQKFFNVSELFRSKDLSGNPNTLGSIEKGEKSENVAKDLEDSPLINANSKI